MRTERRQAWLAPDEGWTAFQAAGRRSRMAVHRRKASRGTHQEQGKCRTPNAKHTKAKAAHSVALNQWQLGQATVALFSQNGYVQNPALSFPAPQLGLGFEAVLSLLKTGSLNSSGASRDSGSEDTTAVCSDGNGVGGVTEENWDQGLLCLLSAAFGNHSTAEAGSSTFKCNGRRGRVWRTGQQPLNVSRVQLRFFPRSPSSICTALQPNHPKKVRARRRPCNPLPHIPSRFQGGISRSSKPWMATLCRCFGTSTSSIFFLSPKLTSILFPLPLYPLSKGR